MQTESYLDAAKCGALSPSATSDSEVAGGRMKSGGLRANLASEISYWIHS